MGQTALLAAVIAAAVSLLGIFLTSRLAERRDWRKARWERELERLVDLEELAGCLVESVLAHGRRDNVLLADQVSKLYAATGRFLRYKELAQAIRELHHTIVCYLADERSFDSASEYEKARTDMDKRFQLLLKEADHAYLMARRRGVWLVGATSASRG